MSSEETHSRTYSDTRQESADGIPVDDFGGEGSLLHFAHANGYPPGCYRRFLAPLQQRFRVLAIRHRPLWPGSSPEELQHWNLIAGDLIHFLKRRNEAPLIGVGHSLGAVTSLLAAAAEPELFDALVLIDPVFLEPQLLEKLYSEPGRSARVPLIRRTLMRRNRFADRRQAFDHYRTKAVFSRLPDDALQDYVEAALCARDGEYVLAYPREWEARVYSLPPREVWDILPAITTPTLALRGANSDTLTPAAWQLWQQRQPGATFLELPDSGHLLPMERPEQVAQIVLNWLTELKMPALDSAARR